MRKIEGKEGQYWFDELATSSLYATCRYLHATTRCFSFSLCNVIYSYLSSRYLYPLQHDAAKIPFLYFLLQLRSFVRSFVRTFVACCSYFKREKRNIKWQKFVFCFSFLFSLTHISTTFRGSRGSFRCGYFLLRQINVKNKSSSELNSKIILFFGNKFSFCSFVVMYRSETLFMHLLKQALWEFLWESILEIKASDYKFMNGNVKEGQ